MVCGHSQLIQKTASTVSKADPFFNYVLSLTHLEGHHSLTETQYSRKLMLSDEPH